MTRSLLFICSLLTLSAFSTEYKGVDASAIVKDANRVITSDTRNSISFVVMDIPFASFEHKTWLTKDVLKCSPGNDLAFFKTETDKIGWTHFRYKQTYKGLPVEDGVYYVHTKNNLVQSANGEYYNVPSLSITPNISKKAAFETARLKSKGKVFSWEKDGSDLTELINASALVVLPHNGKFYLAYKIDIYTVVPMSRANYYVDAHTGNFITSKSTLYESDSQGTAVTFYSGNQTITTDSLSPTSFRLRESGRNIQTWNAGIGNDFFDTDNLWNNIPNLDQFAGDAHLHLEYTYDYYMNMFGHNSFDNAGSPLQIIVHDGMYVNAFWSNTIAQFGDGDGVNYNPLVSAEIVGHEITHGVTQYSAALVYANESGALNESFSDIFGNTIRFVYQPNTATWFVGDEMVIPNSSGQPFRNMSNPNQFGCADTYGGLYWNAGDIVHYDSGVQNFWYYLLVTGGTGVNDIGNNYAVTGIGLGDAAQITYRNLTTYLTPNSTFMDARTFAEQSAFDLFGSCSNQLIQTAEAWYAVGVGTPFTGNVTANFTGNPTLSCSTPLTVNFTNQSFNGSTYQWDFGDGSPVSTQTSPVHAYTNAGVYTVRLITQGTGNCNSIDTLIRTNYITVNNNPGPVSASCYPLTTSYCCGAGITNVTFNTINYNSVDGVENYRDFTCADSTLLVAGNYYPISVTTGMLNPEDVRVWIDYNSDGAFNNTNELVFSSDNTVGVHSGTIYTPTTATLNTLLRMRVTSDVAMNNISGGCYASQRGQTEDYMVYFIPNSLPPVANFTSNVTTVTTGGNVNFFDLSQNAPTSWNWTFTGGVPSSSTAQLPANIVYNAVGVYPVKLVVANGFGNDSITQITYINVVNAANICQTTTMTSLNGLLYDSGGPNGDYQDNENCSFLINPACGGPLTITFNAFDIEFGYDYVSVYDGMNQSAPPLILNATGNTPPGPVIATSGKAFITFTSDFSVIYSGFEIAWSAQPITSPPVAAFNSTPTNPIQLQNVFFTDLSTNFPTSWLWNFGDNLTSTFQNPPHAYALPGTYTVTLIATNCVSSDTTTSIITIAPNSVQDLSQNGSVSLFPNPFNNFSTLVINNAVSADKYVIVIRDMLGRETQKLEVLPHEAKSGVKIQRDELSAGMYFMEIHTINSGSAVLWGGLKFIIQ
jgi:Zn-dependent metalloprotease